MGRRPRDREHVGEIPQKAHDAGCWDAGDEMGKGSRGHWPTSVPTWNGEITTGYRCGEGQGVGRQDSATRVDGKRF